MPNTNDILDRLPFFDRPHVITAEGLKVEIRPDQMVCWGSLSDPLSFAGSPESLPRFPLLIDTGHNHNVSLHSGQLQLWTGLESSKLLRLGDIFINGKRAALYELTLWIHPNIPGMNIIDPNRSPRQVDLDDGISVLPERGFPRIPLLGMRTITSAGLRMEVDGAARNVSLASSSIFGCLTATLG